MKQDHVRANTSSAANQAIDNQMIATLQRFSTASLNEINKRIDKIEKEYNVERVLELNASILAFIGVLLGCICKYLLAYSSSTCTPISGFTLCSRLVSSSTYFKSIKNSNSGGN